jgi:hypothetical protein
MARSRPLPSQTWRTLLTNHAQQLVAADFFVVPTATCRLLFVLVLLAHDRRRVVHFAVTEHPTAAWTAQQFRDAFPWDELPRYLLRDRDHAFDHVLTNTNAPCLEQGCTGCCVVSSLPSRFSRWAAGPTRVYAALAPGDLKATQFSTRFRRRDPEASSDRSQAVLGIGIELMIGTPQATITRARPAARGRGLTTISTSLPSRTRNRTSRSNENPASRPRVSAETFG